jgi:hypothetical protein
MAPTGGKKPHPFNYPYLKTLCKNTSHVQINLLIYRSIWLEGELGRQFTAMSLILKNKTGKKPSVSLSLQGTIDEILQYSATPDFTYWFIDQPH